MVEKLTIYSKLLDDTLSVFWGSSQRTGTATRTLVEEVEEGAAAVNSVGMSVSAESQWELSGYNGHTVHLYEYDWMLLARRSQWATDCEAYVKQLLPIS